MSEMTNVDRPWIVEHLAVLAVALAEDGTRESEALSQLGTFLQRFAVSDVSIIREAAAAVLSLPQPIDETLEETERANPIRELFGVPSAQSQLTATLTGRVWLEKLAESVQSG